MGILDLIEIESSQKKLDAVALFARQMQDKELKKAIMTLVESELLFRRHIFSIINEVKVLEESDRERIDSVISNYNKTHKEFFSR